MYIQSRHTIMNWRAAIPQAGNRLPSTDYTDWCSSPACYELVNRTFRVSILHVLGVWGWAPWSQDSLLSTSRVAQSVRPPVSAETTDFNCHPQAAAAQQIRLVDGSSHIQLWFIHNIHVRSFKNNKALYQYRTVVSANGNGDSFNWITATRFLSAL